MNSIQKRQTFLDIIRTKQHAFVPSAPMVVKDDPTLMFTNAGMNQFKDIFLGNSPVKYPRVANTQKCLRVSGKHNDLEEVGHDTYHHTMFEMLGNWSFGNYFKKEAIEWAWELLTEVYKIDKNDLYVTVFGGDEKDGLSLDREAYDFWKKIIAEDRILAGSKKDNFWEMGDSGPCGPCSEVHVDIRSAEEKAKIPGRELVNTGNPLVIEIWNLVFIEFNRNAAGQLLPLPAKHVDTGMGFERLCMVIQGKQSNYDTDVFQPYINELVAITGIAYGKDKQSDIAMRVISDHLRAVSFAIADGQLPSNNKAGYVIRRILRRAVRYGYSCLDLKEPFMHKLVNVMVKQMGDMFPELTRQQDLIRKVIAEEEQSFLKTLSAGIIKFNNYVASNKSSKTIDGNFTFELYDTYGFPVDLTELMAKEVGLEVDMEGFTRKLEEQKERSRKAASIETDDWIVLNENSSSAFEGYDLLRLDASIIKYRKIKSKDKQFYQLVLDRTPFYAESGGQAGDKGILDFGDEKITVENTVKENDLSIHIVSKLPSDITKGLTAIVDERKRTLTANNHSATHLMHAALRQVLGTHVEQKGSLVDENKLRFDFTHFSKLTDEEIRKTEQLVNRQIRNNIALTEYRDIAIDEAKAMGAMALFGEKYGECVRMIVFDKDFSVELCGGTHVPATGQIGLFKIVSESAIAAGIRRIEAITADKAEEYFFKQVDTIQEIKDAFKNTPDVVKSVKDLQEQLIGFEKKFNEMNREKALGLKASLYEKRELINGISFITEIIEGDAAFIKDIAFALRSSYDDVFAVIGSEANGKAGLTIAIAEKLQQEKNLDASKIIREVAREINGGGGGQAFYATAGGTNISGLNNAFAKAKEIISSI